MKTPIRYKVAGATLVCILLAGLENSCGGVSFTSNTSNQAAAQCILASSCNNTPVTVTQSFTYGPTSSAIDILIIDDNSGSMTDFQQNLAAGFTNFISQLNGIDWQIAVTTTDVADQGQFVGPVGSATKDMDGPSFILTPTTANVETLFNQTIQRTNSKGDYLQGSGDERPIYTSNMVINGSNNAQLSKNFFRANTNLAIVILSNEDERSCGGDQSQPSYYKGTQVTCGTDNNSDDSLALVAGDDYPQDLINNISQTFGGTKNFVIDSIVTKPGDTACFTAQNGANGFGEGAHYGTLNAALATATGGYVASICDDGNGSFAADLVNISTTIKNQVNPQTILLNYVPLSAPTVSFSPSTNAVSYTWLAGTRNITLASYPANTVITVTYTHD